MAAATALGPNPPVLGPGAVGEVEMMEEWEEAEATEAKCSSRRKRWGGQAGEVQ